MFVKYLLAVIEKSDNLVLRYHDLKNSILADIRHSVKKEEEVNDLMFCFLINAGERFIQNKGRQYNLSSNKIFLLLNVYNKLINSYFSIPVKTQLSAETEKYLKEFQRCYGETFLTDSVPFPGCNEFCKFKCLFRYDVEPYVKDQAIDEKLMRTIKDESENEARANVRRLCIDVAHNLTVDDSAMFIESIALCFFIQKSVQWSVKEILLNVKKWFLEIKKEA